MIDGRSAFVLDAAVKVIAAGGAYAHFTLEAAITAILQELDALDAYFNSAPSGTEETEH